MFILGNLVNVIAQLVNFILTALYVLILLRALISWVNADPFNPIVQFLHQTTEPILEPIRRFLPRSPIDFSPLLAALLIYLTKSFLVQSLFEIGLRLKS